MSVKSPGVQSLSGGGISGVLPTANGGTGISVATASGSFVGTLTGCTTAPTQNFIWARNGNVVTITADAGLSATSNTTACTITGVPASIIPARSQPCVGRVTNNSVTGFGVIRVEIDGTITLFPDAVGSAFTNTGTKGILASSITYALN